MFDCVSACVCMHVFVCFCVKTVYHAGSHLKATPALPLPSLSVEEKVDSQEQVENVTQRYCLLPHQKACFLYCAKEKLYISLFEYTPYLYNSTHSNLHLYLNCILRN